MSYPLAQTIGVRKRVADTDDGHGNAVVTFADPVPTLVYGYGPRSADGSAEALVTGRDVITVGLSVYAPPGVDVTPLDRVDVAGVTYEVDGEISDWSHGPFGFAPGVVISLKRVEG